MGEARAGTTEGWEQGLGWIERTAVGAVEAGVDSFRVDTWELMSAVARAAVERRGLIAECDEMARAYADSLVERDALLARLAERRGGDAS